MKRSCTQRLIILNEDAICNHCGSQLELRDGEFAYCSFCDILLNDAGRVVWDGRGENS